MHVAGGTSSNSYYLFDDILVMKVVGCDTTLSVNENYGRDFKIKLYPNPSNGNINLEYNLNNNENGVINIYDITGRLIKMYVLQFSFAL